MKHTCKELAEMYDLSFNAVCNYAREGKIDAEKEQVKSKTGFKTLWIVEMTDKTKSFLEKKQFGVNPETVQVKKSKHNKFFTGECFNYRNDAMGNYIANFYTD